ncbi:MAG TPA: hypothetical protein VGH87_22065 [Polyangiaceae bacterium]
MKDGRSADELRVLFVAEGNDPHEVRAVLAELAALQRQAAYTAAIDPNRLRADAQWIFSQGGGIDAIVAHFVQNGIAEIHARPEAERLVAIFQTLRPCQRCGTPSPPESFVMDVNGLSICRSCNLRDGINASQSRAIASDLEAIGGFGLASTVAGAIATAVATPQPVGASPWCATCRAQTGVHVNVAPYEVRARLDPRWQWICRQCWRPIA